MKSYRYAQIDENGYIISESFLSGEVEHELMIPLAEDEVIVGKMYKGGKWVDDDREEEHIEEEPTTEDIQSEILLNQAQMMTKQQEHDDVLAEILLAQTEKEM